MAAGIMVRGVGFTPEKSGPSIDDALWIVFVRSCWCHPLFRGLGVRDASVDVYDHHDDRWRFVLHPAGEPF